MIAYLAGLLSGSALAAGFMVLREIVNRRRASPTPELSDEDRGEIAQAFEVHTTAVQQQVSNYADVLADGDPVLRERLRLFEKRAC